TNVLVVGGGLAGLSAAVEALHQTRNAAGITVTLLEKEARTGGNSAKASSGINGVLTRTQKEKNIKDSVDAFVKDTLKSGHGRSNETLVDKLARESTQAVSWLQGDFSLDLDVLAQLGGHSFPRTHRRPDLNGKPQPVGWGIVSALGKYLTGQAAASNVRFSLLTGARVTELLSGESGRVVGVAYETADTETKTTEKRKLHSDVVILATGGFAGEGSSPVFLKKYAPELVGLPATNGPFATGDGLRLATAIGAELVDMDQVQVHPTGFVKASDPTNPTKFLAAEALRGEGGVLLTGLGKRFVNELDTRDKVTEAINMMCSGADTCARHSRSTERAEGEPRSAAFLVLSQAAADSFGRGALGFYQKMGLVNRADSLEELAAAMGVDLAALKQTLEEHDDARSGKTKDQFGKAIFPQNALNPRSSEKEEGLGYYWAIVTPSLHYTMGGLRFDERTRVLRASDRAPIPGLLAAGEVTGGLHGANRLGGNSLLECVVYGREAGRQAAE
ncbi:Flavocytochrome c, partial [Martensiomyces pterosporus]